MINILLQNQCNNHNVLFEHFDSTEIITNTRPQKANACTEIALNSFTEVAVCCCHSPLAHNMDVFTARCLAVQTYAVMHFATSY